MPPVGAGTRISPRVRHRRREKPALHAGRSARARPRVLRARRFLRRVGACAGGVPDDSRRHLPDRRANHLAGGFRVFAHGRRARPRRRRDAPSDLPHPPSGRDGAAHVPDALLAGLRRQPPVAGRCGRRSLRSPVSGEEAVSGALLEVLRPDAGNASSLARHRLRRRRVPAVLRDGVLDEVAAPLSVSRKR